MASYIHTYKLYSRPKKDFQRIHDNIFDKVRYLMVIERSSPDRRERFGFEPFSGALRCVLGQDTLLSQCLSPPSCINGYRQT